MSLARRRWQDLAHSTTQERFLPKTLTLIHARSSIRLIFGSISSSRVPAKTATVSSACGICGQMNSWRRWLGIIDRPQYSDYPEINVWLGPSNGDNGLTENLLECRPTLHLTEARWHPLTSIIRNPPPDLKVEGMSIPFDNAFPVQFSVLTLPTPGLHVSNPCSVADILFPHDKPPSSCENRNIAQDTMRYQRHKNLKGWQKNCLSRITTTTKH